MFSDVRTSNMQMTRLHLLQLLFMLRTLRAGAPVTACRGRQGQRPPSHGVWRVLRGNAGGRRQLASPSGLCEPPCDRRRTWSPAEWPVGAAIAALRDSRAGALLAERLCVLSSLGPALWWFFALKNAPNRVAFSVASRGRF